MKKILFFILYINAFPIFAQIGNGMISQYYFCGNANDVIGVNNGIVRGASLTTDRFGNANSAYSFNGVNNLINLGTTNSLKTTTMSISLWAKITSYTNTAAGYANQPFITTRSRNTTSSYEAYFMGMYSPTSKIDAATTSTTGAQNAILSNFTASLNVWNHVVYMFRQDSAFLYINGVFQQQVLKGFTSGYLAGDSVTLGYVGSGLSTYSYLNGCLDDIRIYNRQLTNSEINQLYSESNPTPIVNPSSTGGSLICSGQPVSLIAGGASTYTWIPSATGATITITPTVTTTYTVTGTAINGCSNSNTFTQNVIACTGISEELNFDSEIKIYPNPNINGVLKIEANSISSIMILNMLGQVVYQSNDVSEKIDIDLSDQRSGVYSVRICKGEKVIAKKLVIER